MSELIFATSLGTAASAREVQLWARSIRRFAGRLADAPIWLMVAGHTEHLPPAVRIAFDNLGIRLIPFEIGGDELDFPFGGKTIAAGTAEALADEHDALLVWMDRDSLILQEPLPLLLARDQVLGFRPVDHTLIGSRISEPPDPFWSLIYDHFGIDPLQLMPMRTTVDEQALRPYYNAGMLVIRPGGRILRRWSENFRRLYDKPSFTPYYEQDFLYRLFMHQAVLAGTILANSKAEERLELPHLVNYALHMHSSYPHALRVGCLNDVITCRYDTLADEARWENVIPIGEPLRGWLREQRNQLAHEH